jgi:hypothetical protein
MIKGESVYIPFTVYKDQAKKQIADLSGATIYCTAKKRIEDLDSEKLFEKSVGSGITIVSASDGTAQIEILPADTNEFTIKQFYFEVIVKLSGSNQVVRTGSGMMSLLNNTRKALP